MHNTRPEWREKHCANRTCLRLSFRFTEPPHRATQVKQPGQGDRSPILDPAGHAPPTRGSRPPVHHPAPVAQWIEQVPSKHLAAGSSPAGGAPPQTLLREGLFAGHGLFPVGGRGPDGPPARRTTTRADSRVDHARRLNFSPDNGTHRRAARAGSRGALRRDRGHAFRVASISATRPSIRTLISSRMGRTAATPWPAGSSRAQSRYFLPGKTGQASPQPMVMT